jgi:hypothetical protein
MKIISKSKKITTIGHILIAITLAITINSCIEGKKLAAKSGTELWAENCQRCHNAPPANTFNDQQWKTIGMHMQTRALLTNQERDKIVQFLQAGSH